MLKWIIRICLLFIGGTIGVFAMPELWPFLQMDKQIFINNAFINAMLGALIFYLVTCWIVKYMERLLNWFEVKLNHLSGATLLYGGFGLLIGLLVAYLIGNALNKTHLPIINSLLPILLTLILSYLGFRVGNSRKNELSQLFSGKILKRKSVVNLSSERTLHERCKILDTSVIIDGRIADVLLTGFLSGAIIIPSFVLVELQRIADSADALKRIRGRRGLDILNRLQKESSIHLEMYDQDFEDIAEVDSKLVRLAKLMDGILVTNDYNLNKVSEFQQVAVLNINDLAKAVKPVVLPGETMSVLIIKNGTEHNQGVAYLDDGTMIVIDDGHKFINEVKKVEVTSVLQTSAGRMIFAKLT